MTFIDHDDFDWSGSMVENYKLKEKFTMKHYLVSSLITFASAFCLVLLADWNSITLEALKTGAIAGLLFAGIRAGVKAVIEYFLAKHTTLME